MVFQNRCGPVLDKSSLSIGRVKAAYQELTWTLLHIRRPFRKQLIWGDVRRILSTHFYMSDNLYKYEFCKLVQSIKHTYCTHVWLVVRKTDNH